MTRCYDDQPGLSITIGAHTAKALIDAALYRVGELLVHQQMTLTTDEERRQLNLEAQALVGEIAAVRALLQDAQADYVDPGPADGVIDWPAAGEAMDAPGAGTLLVDAEHHGVIPDPRPEPSLAQAECWAVVDDSGNVVKVMATSESADGVAREWNADREALGGDPIYVVRRLGGSAQR